MHDSLFFPMIKYNRTLLAAVLPLFLIACEQSPPDETPGPVREPVDATTPLDNPLLERYLTPFHTPPFHRLEAEHFLPALVQAIDQQSEAIESIVNESAAPDFSNTIEALEFSGEPLSRIARTYYGLVAVSPDRALHEIAGEFSALLSAHNDSVLFNRALVERIDAVDRQTDAESLGREQYRLLEQTRARFARAGAGLSNSRQERLEAINSSLAELGRTFDFAVREATHRFELLIEDESLLSGLPESLVNLAARNARDRGHDHGWAFTLHAHSLYPFLRHFPDRNLRRQIYRAWIDRVKQRHGQQHDPAQIMHRMAILRAERAALLGFDNHIDYLLDDSTLGSRNRLRELLDQVAEAARRQVGDELARLQELARADGIDEPMQPWDWWFYGQRLAERELALGETELRNWFSLDQVRDGAFALANRLWGLSFHLRTDFPIWHPEVAPFEVRDERGRHLGVLYLDYRHRQGKQGGAWASGFRAQRYDGEERIAPVVANVANFPPPAGGLPSLLSPDEVRTLFHEFGHALHELLSDVSYTSLAGSAVPADFVEFPALLMERWALQPEVLRMYAYHHQTGNLISDDAIAALQHQEQLTWGLETLQFVAAIELDLALHGVAEDQVPTLEAAEQAVSERLGLPALLSPRHHGNGLSSLFSVLREGGDYRVLWAEVMAADAFAAFGETAIMNRELAERLRDEIFSRGNARDPMKSWQEFRGREPDVRYLLEARGLAE